MQSRSGKRGPCWLSIKQISGLLTPKAMSAVTGHTSHGVRADTGGFPWSCTSNRGVPRRDFLACLGTDVLTTAYFTSINLAVWV